MRNERLCKADDVVDRPKTLVPLDAAITAPCACPRLYMPAPDAEAPLGLAEPGSCFSGKRLLATTLFDGGSPRRSRGNAVFAQPSWPTRHPVGGDRRSAGKRGEGESCPHICGAFSPRPPLFHPMREPLGKSVVVQADRGAYCPRPAMISGSDLAGFQRQQRSNG